MNIIIRNLISIMCNNTLAQDRPLEAMSNYKWQQTALLLMALGLDAEQMMPREKRWVAANAKQQLRNARKNNHPTVVQTETPAHDEDTETVVDVIDLLHPTLCNRRLNRKLQALKEEEEKDNDRAPVTWEFFSLLVYNAEQLIGGYIHMPSLLRQASLLKEKGHLIDYPKLETWIHEVRITIPVGWLTTVTTEVFQLDADEIQYAYRYHSKAASMLYGALHRMLKRVEKASHTPRSLGKAILLPLSTVTPQHHGGQRLLPRRTTLRYAPREALPLLMHNFHIRMEAIEE